MVKAIDDLYVYNKEGSSNLFQEAEEVIPGGVTANIKHFDPHPIFMKKGKGSRLIDVDNEEYIDYSLCYGALITGHGHPEVMKATSKQLMDSGTVIFGTPHELEITMAKKINELYPSMERIRYANSGTEANLLATRLAIAHTHKEKIAKFEGHYHGGLNNLLVSVNPSEANAGPAEKPVSVYETDGIAEDERHNTIVLPFNDLDSTEKLLRKHADELAAVFIEPIQGGFIPATHEFMKGLKKLTDELNIVLIFDEVKTGFRVHLRGAQHIYDVKPDLTTLGKVLGGGFPVGAIGGKKEIMEKSAANAKGDVFAVGSDSAATTDVVFHSGTYNGHPVVLAAGLETIELLEKDNLIDNLFANTMQLRRRLENLYAKYNIPMKAIGVGSIFNIVFTDEEVNNYRDLWNADMDFRKDIDMELLNLGIHVKPLNRYSMSTMHTLKDIDDTVNAHETAIKNVLARRGR